MNNGAKVLELGGMRYAIKGGRPGPGVIRIEVMLGFRV